MAYRRKPSKIKKLPEELFQAVNDRLAAGNTYAEIADWLTRMGHPVSKSSVQRYRNDWAEVTERVKTAQEQAGVLVRELRERPNSDLAEAIEQMILTNVSSVLADGQLDMSDGDPVRVGNMVANLQRSGLLREKLKLQFRAEYEARLSAAADKVENIVKKGGLSEETVQKIRSEILGVTG